MPDPRWDWAPPPGARLGTGWDDGVADVDAALDEMEAYLRARRALAAGGAAGGREADRARAARDADTARILKAAAVIPVPWPWTPRAAAIRAVLTLPRSDRPPPPRRPLPLHVRLGPPRRLPPRAWRGPAATPSWDQKETLMQYCKNGHMLAIGHKFCGQCGQPAAASVPRCRACGQPLRPGTRVPPDRAAGDHDDTDRGEDDASFGKARGRDIDDEVAGERVLPGVGDLAAPELLFKATLADQGATRLSTHDVAKLEAYTNDGLSLHQIAARDPALAVRVHRAVMLAGQ
jgi:hypothetical protein